MHIQIHLPFPKAVTKYLIKLKILPMLICKFYLPGLNLSFLQNSCKYTIFLIFLGTTLVLYDGSPLHPHPDSMWDLVDECGITIFGTSAKWIAVQEDRGVKPRLTHKLTSLKAICSTGSPLKPHSFDYVYRDIKPNVLLASISGGTDIIACFMGENSTLPVFR